MKLTVNTRDEMTVIDLQKLAFLQAEGNYTRLVYIEGFETLLAFGLSKLELIIKMTIKEERYKKLFVRFGRSVIINRNYLVKIDNLKSKVILSDYGKHTYTLDVPKIVVKSFKLNSKDNK